MSLESLTTPLTVDEVKTAIYAALAANGVTTTSWKPGAVVRTMIAGVSIVIAALSRLQAEIAKSGFLELAEGAWLTLVALYVYNVERDEGAFATGEVTLVNTGGGVFAGDAGDLIFLNTATGKTYRNTGTYALGSGATITIPVQAIELGTESNAAPGEIDDFETPLLAVTVSNAASVVGRDPEEDPELRTRCYEKTGVASPNGPWDAYSFFARSAVREDGSLIGVTRVRSIPDGNGNITVYVATGAGEVSDPADVAAIDDTIQENVVPLGVTAVVQSAVPLLIPVTYELWVRNTSGLSDAQIQDAVSDALTTFVSGQPIGGNVISPATGKVYVSAIRTVIGATQLVEIVRVDVTSPAADVDVDIDEAPVLGSISVTGIHQITSGEI